MNIIYIAIALITILLILWLSWGFYTSHDLETPSYTVLETVGEYEIRKYDSYLVAQVEVEGEWQEAINQGFRILAGYIFGGNQSQQSIKMTAPVTEVESVQIAMTAPVTETEVEGRRIISFVVPTEFSLDTLPIPNDSRIEFVEIEEKTMFASSFTWYATTDRVAKKKIEILEAAEANNLTPLSPPTFASYNDPFTFPLMQRHEILLEISSDGTF